MKRLKSTYLAAGLIAATALLTGCQADIDAPGLKTPTSTAEANITIADLKETFSDFATVGQIGTRPDGSHYVIKGRVISSDATGNIYQALYIQDQTSAILFSIDRASLYNIYPVGQEVIVDVTGLWIGHYSELMEIGTYYSSGGTAQPGRMLYQEFKNHSQMNGLPDSNFKYVKYGSEYPAGNPYCIITTIEELPAAGSAERRNLDCQLVEFHNVHFQDAGKTIFAPYQESNVKRVLVDQKGNTINLNNSGYSSFWADILPEGEGTVRGLLTTYNSDWQLTIRSTEDILFGSKGKREDPYTIEEAIATDNNGMTAWTEGYIVGATRIGAATLDPSTAIFGVEGNIFPGTLLLGPTPDCRDVARCMVLELPQNSRLREYANLLDNPDVLGHKMIVNGTYESFMGAHGITGSGGTFADFSIEGFEIDAPDGLGDESMPYTCNYLLNNPDDNSVAWVGGYVVGFVTGNNYNAPGAVHFELPDEDADYGNQNLVIGPTADCKDPALCVVVRTSSKRAELGLKNNPDVFGKFLKVEGQLGTYLDRAAVTTINQFKY